MAGLHGWVILNGRCLDGSSLAGEAGPGRLGGGGGGGD